MSKCFFDYYDPWSPFSAGGKIRFDGINAEGFGANSMSGF
jgi:hypothetical protein